MLIPQRFRGGALEDRVYGLRMARQRKRAVAELTAEPDSTAAAIGRALRDTQNDRTSPEEAARIRRIEDLRAELIASDNALGDGSDESQRVSVLAEKVSKPREWGLMMLRLIREVQPERCLELGTCIGLSAAYQGTALDLNGAGRLVTLDADGDRSAFAGENLERLGVGNVERRVGRFEQTLDPALAEGPVDFAFIDGHHQGKPTLDYFERIAENATRPAVLLFDDVGPRIPEMREAWQKIAADPRVDVAVEVRWLGICVLGDGSSERSEPIVCPLFA